MPSSRVSKRIRDVVTKRAARRCEYCFTPLDYSPDPFAIEHIIPRSKNGTDSLDNLALACFGCNNAKYNHISGIDSATGQEVALYNPRTDIWSEHFRWEDVIITAITIKAQVTIDLLRLNRPALVNLRQLLISVGLHPPLEDGR